jgi:Nucleoside-diphosphate-sugar epimerases
MRALITGINGFVGGHLAEHLLSSGRWEIAGIARQPALALETLTGRVTYVAADLSDREQTLGALAGFALTSSSTLPVNRTSRTHSPTRTPRFR